MPTILKLKNSVTAAAAPTTLVQGEAAVNVTDKKVWVGNAASSPVQILGAGATVAGTTATLSSLTSGRVTYAGTSGVLQDSANFTFNGTTVTIANDASISGLTVGKGGGAVATNTAVGASALSANTTGSYNTAVNQSLRANTTGANNIGIGWALNTNTTGSNLVGIGLDCLAANSTGGSNTAVGVQALTSNTTASNNTALGYQAAYTSTTGDQITAIGGSALKLNTGSGNTAVGEGALTANTSAASNTAVGQGSATSNTTGAELAALGRGSLFSNTTGSNNTAIGRSALFSNTTASQNTAVGYQAGYANTTAPEGAFFGYQAGRNSTGGSNTIIGSSAGFGVTSGSNNTILGTASANWVNVLTTGANNVYLGYGCNPSSATVSNETIVGYNGTGKGASTGFYVASSGNYQSNNSASWSTTSDQRLKKNIVDNTTGLEIINKIQVRNFEYRLPDEVTDLPKEQVIDKAGVQLGVIAQELQAVLPECVKEQSTGVLTVDTDSLTWYLINAVKQLNAKVQALEAQLNK